MALLKPVKELIKKIISGLGYELRGRTEIDFALFGYGLKRRSDLEYALKEQKRLLGLLGTDGLGTRGSGSRAVKTIFDVGAYIGDITKQYRAIFPQAKVYSFEPFPPSFQTLQAQLSQDPNVEAFNLALADEAGEKTYFANKIAPTNSLLEVDEQAGKYWGEGRLSTEEAIEVQATTLDQFCRSQNITQIDILKMDVQGYEYLVLLGAQGMLKNISLIYTEILLAPTYKNQASFGDIYNLLLANGFELYNWYSPVFSAQRQISQIDAIFISPALKNCL
jgi:FkbM family methyltransferase